MRRDGNPGERAVAQIGREMGYLVSSRRHEGGAGDQVWCCFQEWCIDFTGGSELLPAFDRPVLIEVKAGRDPWEHFRPDDRAAMIEAGVRWNVTPLLAFVLSVKKREVMFIPVEDWPA